MVGIVPFYVIAAPTSRSIRAGSFTRNIEFSFSTSIFRTFITLTGTISAGANVNFVTSMILIPRAVTPERKYRLERLTQTLNYGGGASANIAFNFATYTPTIVIGTYLLVNTGFEVTGVVGLN